jgi:hypothetical protein
MAARKAAGATWRDVAAEFGVAVSTARAGVADHRDAATSGGVVGALLDPLRVRPADAVRDALATYAWAADRLRALATSADNSSAAVGAVRAAVAVADGRLQLLVLAGVLPSAETAYAMEARARMEEDLGRFARALVDALERRGIDPAEVLDGLPRVAA